jgi:hypothetical protein
MNNGGEAEGVEAAATGREIRIKGYRPGKSNRRRKCTKPWMVRDPG